MQKVQFKNLKELNLGGEIRLWDVKQAVPWGHKTTVIVEGLDVWEHTVFKVNSCAWPIYMLKKFHDNPLRITGRVGTYRFQCGLMCIADLHEDKMTEESFLHYWHIRWWRFEPHNDDVIKWKPFPRYWPFVRGIHRSPVTGEFPAQRAVMRSFDVFFDLRLSKRLSKQLRGWWLEMPSRTLWRHCNDTGLTRQICDCICHCS